MKKTFDVEHFIEELKRKCALTEVKKFKKKWNNYYIFTKEKSNAYSFKRRSISCKIW